MNVIYFASFAWIENQLNGYFFLMTKPSDLRLNAVLKLSILLSIFRQRDKGSIVESERGLYVIGVFKSWGNRQWGQKHDNGDNKWPRTALCNSPLAHDETSSSKDTHHAETAISVYWPLLIYDSIISLQRGTRARLTDLQIIG
jgi:hypothetical protein